MVDSFNENMNKIKETMSSRHEQERKRLFLSYTEHPSKKYASMAVLTEDMFATLHSEDDETHC